MAGTATASTISTAMHEPACCCGQPLEPGAGHCPRCGIDLHH